MQPPRLPIEHPDLIDDLDGTVAPAVVALMTASKAAGWDPWEIDTAFRAAEADWVKSNAKPEAPVVPAVEIEPEIAELLARIRPGPGDTGGSE